jgi:hypothetical protein
MDDLATVAASFPKVLRLRTATLLAFISYDQSHLKAIYKE